MNCICSLVLCWGTTGLLIKLVYVGAWMRCTAHLHGGPAPQAQNLIKICAQGRPSTVLACSALQNGSRARRCQSTCCACRLALIMHGSASRRDDRLHVHMADHNAVSNGSARCRLTQAAECTCALCMTSSERLQSFETRIREATGSPVMTL